MKHAAVSNLASLALLVATLSAGPLMAEPATNAVFTPENPPAMQPLKGRDTPAYHAAQWFRHGANLGDYLESWPRREWSIQVAPEEFAQMKHEGFDHVRVPIGWQHYAGPGPDFTLSPEIFGMADYAVTNRPGQWPGGDDQHPSFRRAGR